jgi:hypothetical protein
MIEPHGGVGTRISAKGFIAENFSRVVLVKQSERRRSAGMVVIKMNKRKLVMAVGLIVGTIGFGGTMAQADNVILKEVRDVGSYCHLKFPAIREETLAGTSPTLATSDDLVDYYGSCDRDSLGKGEIQARRIESQHMLASSYEG